MRSPYKASALLALLSAMALAPHYVAAHGSLFSPRPRNWLTNSQWTGVAPWYTYSRDSAGNPIIRDPGINGVENFGNGHGGGSASGPKPLAGPGVCGDPYQHYSASNFASLASLPIQATYTQGQIITVEWVIAANHGGRIGLKVCPTGRTGLTQACFDAPGRQLQRSDGLGPHYYITEGTAPPGGLAGWLGRRSGTFRLPAGVSCANGCVLQWEYLTMNSCFPSDLANCDARACGVYKQLTNPVTSQTRLGTCCLGATCNTAFVPEVFYNCADIRINPTGTPPVAPPPGPVAPPPGPVTPPPPTTTGDPCPGIGPGPARAACFCRNRAFGRYQDTTYQCTGGFWCFNGGSQYVPCATGLRYDTVNGGICNWAAQVACDGARVAPASLTARRRNRRTASGGEQPAVAAPTVDAAVATAAVAVPDPPSPEDVAATAGVDLSVESVANPLAVVTMTLAPPVDAATAAETEAAAAAAAAARAADAAAVTSTAVVVESGVVADSG